VGIRCSGYATQSTRKSRKYFIGYRGRWFGTFRLRNESHGFCLFCLFVYNEYTAQKRGHSLDWRIAVNGDSDNGNLWALRYFTELQAWQEAQSREGFVSIYVVLAAAIGPGGYSPSNRKEYQMQIKMFWGLKRGRYMRLTTLAPTVCQFSRQCGILNISQLYRPP
jgi:hypothetical protein